MSDASKIILDPDDPTRARVANATDEIFGAHIGAVVLHNVHPEHKCASQKQCIIHKPSPHHMRDWPLVWRGDKSMFERTCPHGVGHPDPDSVAFLKSIGKGILATHGCDGCCHEKTESELL